MILMIADLHLEIANRLRALRSGRVGLPVFCLEHGLDEQGRQRLVESVGAAVRRHGISAWWQDKYLPLLVAATETGYGYLGTGTDFWPRFSASIGADVGDVERQSISSLFEDGHRSFGLQSPVPTPWNKAFRHIAWPITNAIAPREIHRSLANALTRIWRSVRGEASETALVEALRVLARQESSPRLLEWLANDDLAAAVVMHLLHVPDEKNRISADALDRVLADLMSDREARHNVQQAVRLRERSVSGAPRRIPSFSRCELRLSKTEPDGLTLSFRCPVIPQELRDSLRRRLSAGAIGLVFWGRLGPIDPDQFLSGYPIPITLNALPSTEDTFLPAITDLAEESVLLRRFAECGPNLALPLVFRVRGSDETSIVEPGGTLSANAIYRVLTTDPPKAADGISILGMVAGLHCVEIEPGLSAARMWIEQRGHRVSGEVAFDLVGGIPLGNGADGPVFATGLPILVSGRGMPSGRWTAALTTSEGREVATLDTGRPVTALDAVPGKHSLVLECAGIRRQIKFEVVEPSPRGETVELAFEPREPSVDDFMRGVVTLKLSCELPLEEVRVELRVVATGTELTRTSGILPRLPSLVGPESPLLKDLTQPDLWSGLFRDSRVDLVVEVAGFWRFTKRLGWQMAECVWEVVDGCPVPMTSDGPVPMREILASQPLTEPEEVADVSQVTREFRALIPEVDGRLVVESAVCVGPRTLSPGSVVPVLPTRLLRQEDSHKEGVGLIPCLAAYAIWSCASPSHHLADWWRRAAIRLLEAAAVEQLCGKTWAEAENYLRPLAGDRWSSFLEVCEASSLVSGGAFPKLDPGVQLRLTARLSSAMRKAVPDLWIGGVDSRNCEELGERLDGAVATAYEDLRLSLDLEGLPSFGTNDVDPGEDPENWRRAIVLAANRHEISPLLALMMPVARAEALRVPDYTQLSADDILSLLDKYHVDVQGRSRWLTREDLWLALAIWTNPRLVLRTPGWRTSVGKLLSDRQAARAARYAALRLRASRALGSPKARGDHER